MLFLGKNFAGATFKKGENIDQFLLDYCNKTLTEITTPADCDIRNYFFRDQNQLQSVTFGEGCTTLNYGVCMDCSSLRNVYIPNSVTYIESDAFSGCSNVHFIIDNSSSNLRGYPWGADGCSVEWLRGDDGPSLDSNFIFYNDYNTMEQSSQQSNGWHGFVFQPATTPCVNPESLEMLYQGRPVVAIEVMKNQYPRTQFIQFNPVYVEVLDNSYGDYGYYMTRSINEDAITPGSFEESVRFDFDTPIQLDPYGYYKVHFKMTGYENSAPQLNQICPATYFINSYDPRVGCFWGNNPVEDGSSDMVAFKLIFE
jgi:hypothetical protein